MNNVTILANVIDEIKEITIAGKQYVEIKAISIDRTMKNLVTFMACNNLAIVAKETLKIGSKILANGYLDKDKVVIESLEILMTKKETNPLIEDYTRKHKLIHN